MLIVVFAYNIICGALLSGDERRVKVRSSLAAGIAR
jgi:hypothetical protein